MSAVFDTDSTVGTDNKVGLSTDTSKVIKNNVSGSLSVGGANRSTGGCGDGQKNEGLYNGVFSFHALCTSKMQQFIIYR